jgi:low temperature requirement protein LtrA
MAGLPSTARPQGDGAAIPVELVETGVEQEKRVTSLELFFDLVFVFAITQVTGFVATDPTWTRLVEGLAVLALLWFAWSGYAWLGNTANAEDELVRLPLLGAMGAMLIASLSVPHAFGKYGLIFGVAYFLVRVFHIGTYAVFARHEHDAELARVVGRLATTIMPAATLILVAGTLDGTSRAIVWALALLVDYGGVLIRGVEGWRISAGHFAERHGLIIIIALGESIVSLGLSAGRDSLDLDTITAALLGLAVAAALWWAYFDVVALVAERRLRRAPPAEQALIARDSYTYLHLPMVAGIIVFAIGVKRSLPDLSAELALVPAVTLCGGVALYLLALSAFKRRNIGTFNRQRLAVAAALVLFIPVATAIPALAALAVVAAAACGLIAFEVTRYPDTRRRIRHAADAAEAAPPG